MIALPPAPLRKLRMRLGAPVGPRRPHPIYFVAIHVLHRSERGEQWMQAGLTYLEGLVRRANLPALVPSGAGADDGRRKAEAAAQATKARKKADAGGTWTQRPLARTLAKSRLPFSSRRFLREQCQAQMGVPRLRLRSCGRLDWHPSARCRSSLLRTMN